MITIILTIHIMIAAALIVSVLLQRSEGGGLGIGGGGGMGSFMSARGTANLMTRVTTVLAACFMGTSIVLAILSDTGQRRSIVDQVPTVNQVEEDKEPQAPVAK